jgi:hypothetical protein
VLILLNGLEARAGYPSFSLGSGLSRKLRSKHYELIWVCRRMYCSVGLLNLVLARRAAHPNDGVNLTTPGGVAGYNGGVRERDMGYGLRDIEFNGRLLSTQRVNFGDRMTFGVYFHAERALLRFVKEAVDPGSPTGTALSPTELANGSVCVFACAAALEAMANTLLLRDGRLRHWDELRIRSKLDTLADFGATPIEWGRQPWQDIAMLIRVRNWLAHFKDPEIGLIGEGGSWVEDGVNRTPGIDPEAVLSKDSIRCYYDAVRSGMALLARGLGQADEFEFLVAERYDHLYVG